jgi:hypothetical protein
VLCRINWNATFLSQLLLVLCTVSAVPGGQRAKLWR